MGDKGVNDPHLQLFLPNNSVLLAAELKMDKLNTVERRLSELIGTSDSSDNR